ESNGSANGSPSGIINDKAVVIFGGYSGWIGGAGHYAGPMAYSKVTGLPQWGPNAEEPFWSIQTDPSVPDVYSEVVMPGVLTCETLVEPTDNDWFIFGNVDGWWNFVNTDVGEIVWHRRSARFFTYVTGPIMDEAGHIIFGEQWNLHCMANDVPRQRLHIADLSPELPVPFGLPTYHEIVFEDVIANSGCTDLEIFHVELLDEDNGTFPARLHQIDNDRAENISTLAMKATGIEEKLGEALDSRAAAEGFIKSRKINTAAYALPAYILSLLEPTDNTIIPAGGSVDIRLAINGELVPRGATQFYAEIHSDDPDYFLDSAYMDYGADAADPTILLTVVGGCLYNSMDFYFGDGGANHYPIWNSTHIMIPNSGNFEIDGNADLYGSDGLFYTIDTHRVVMHAYDGGGNPIWESILPDPLPSCDFAIATDVALAEMSDDGSAYSTVLGTMVNYAYVDSVEDHRVYDVDTTVTPWDTTITWEWDLETESGLNLPYSNELTEGWAFKAHVTEYAVTDVTGPKYGFEDFWNFTISRHSLFSRYGTAIPGLYVGQVADWDVHGGGTNAAGYSAEYSASWQYEPSETDFGGGTIKIPFGPGFEPMRGTVDATTAWYGGEEPGFDS
ncbi:MAG: hypothetical protein GY845_39050, partial [Planctomycetes bacterium]|nr:hypothetical protein [Planctomycetota bacterium]